MLQRCNNPKNTSYPKYGGRGIKVCDSWLKFESFLADMGERPKGKTLDRFPDNKGNYESGNCRWATYKEQGHNRITTKMTSLLITQIQKEYATGTKSTWQLAKQFECSQNLIFRAIHTKVL